MRRIELHPDFDLRVDDHVDQHAVFRSLKEADATALPIVQSVLAPAGLAAKMCAIADFALPCRSLPCPLAFNSPAAQ